MSVPNLEKPEAHVSLADWAAALWELRQTADTQRGDAFQLRNSARQLRNETAVRTRWDTYLTDSRLRDRCNEVTRWSELLTACLHDVEAEMHALSTEKTRMETALERLNLPLAVTSECLSLRDGRRGPDLTRDDADTELRKELRVLEGLKHMLTNRSHDAWEQLNRLSEVQFQLQLDLNNKQDAIGIDEVNMLMNRNSSGISYKPDPLRIPKNCIPYEAWVEHSRYNKLKAEGEVFSSAKLRESLFIAMERSVNDVLGQADTTNYALRRRIHELERAKNELEWQQDKMRREMDAMAREVDLLDDALKDKTDAQKLAETRLENRMFRPGPELVQDEAQEGLGQEVRQLRQTRADLSDRLDALRAKYCSLEQLQARVESDLDDKRAALQNDLRCLDMRRRLEPGPSSQTSRNIKLTALQEQIPEE